MGVTKFYVDQDGNYLGGFDGAAPPAGAVEVPDPPEHGQDQRWNGAAWEDLPDRPGREAAREIAVGFERDRLARLVFEIEFDQENRLRALEGKPAVTRAQYRDALVSRIKAL